MPTVAGRHVFERCGEVDGPYLNEELARRGPRASPRQGRHRDQFGFKIDGTNGLDSRLEAHLARRRGIDEAPQGPIASFSTINTAPTDRANEDVAGTVKGLIKAEGAAFGLSEPSATTIRRAHAVQPVAAIRPSIAIEERRAQRRFTRASELGIGFVRWGPLGQGFLPGQWT